MNAKLKFLLALPLFLISASVCNLTQSSPASPSPSMLEEQTPLPSETSRRTPILISTEMVDVSPLPSPTMVSERPSLPEEAILILLPGPGSRLVSPARVSGEADSTFEQNLVIRLLSADGGGIAQTSTLIQSELGQRGPFEAELSFDVTEERRAFIQVYDTSPRDGGLIHLSSVGVTLAPSGSANVVPTESHPERIVIDQPVVSQVVQGGVVHVEGFALASFEQTLVVEVHDSEGDVVGSQPIIVQAPDLGEPGHYRADVLYQVEVAGPGRIVVRDPSAAFAGDVHLASVEVMLEP